jgi:hypothetical protein
MDTKDAGNVIKVRTKIHGSLFAEKGLRQRIVNSRAHSRKLIKHRLMWPFLSLK